MPAGSRKQIENGMSSMTTRKRAKAMVSPQFPSLFPPALVCFLFPVCRRGKLETKAVSWVNFTYEDTRKRKGNKGVKTALSFHAVRPPLFPFLFPLHRFNRK